MDVTKKYKRAEVPVIRVCLDVKAETDEERRARGLEVGAVIGEGPRSRNLQPKVRA